MQLVHFPPLPLTGVGKAHFGDFAGTAEKKLLLSIFHISYAAHWKALHMGVMAWHIYKRSIDGQDT